MADYQLTQTGDQVQEILNNAAYDSDVQTVANDLSTEISNRQNADTTLQQNIDAEVTNRQNAVSAEATARENAVAAEATARENAVAAETQRAQGAESTLQGNIDAINNKIPSEASSSNQLADKQFVNDSIATATATFRGTYNQVSDLGLAVTATHEQIAVALASVIAERDNNDYCFIQVPAASDTPTVIARIDRYKFDGTAWAFEYSLNNSGFTAAQWDAINSGITSGMVTKLNDLPTNAELTTLLNGKQDTISDLSTIRSGAAAGATAYQKPVNGIPATDMTSGVQQSLQKAEEAAPQATTYTKTEVDAAIAVETQRAQGAEGTLQDNIDAEETRAKAAEQQNADDIDAIEAKIPSAASSSNQLADKEFVNSTAATNTATFRGSYNLVNDLHLTTAATRSDIATALASTIATSDSNDYCFVQIPTADETPTEIARVERYKYNGSAWAFEYELNNSGFTSAQWDALNSAITSGLVTKLNALPTNAELTTLLNGKQDTISDLSTIRTGAAAGATAYQKPSAGIPKTDLTQAVQTSLDKADAAAPQSTTFTKTEVNSAIAVETQRAQAAEQANADDIDAIEGKIPSAATSSNQLADKNYVDTADGTLQGNITAEATRAQAAEQANADDIDAIEAKIPAAATSSNQLADKAFVNSTVATNTATFKGTYNSLEELRGVVGANENDYGFVISTDAAGNTVYNRYKYTSSDGWAFEYALNNSSFTASEWDAIQSGISSGLVDKLDALYTKAQLDALLAQKQGTLTFDTAPTANSTNPVQSGGVKTALDAKQDTLTFDNNPEQYSNNPVKSGGIYAANQTLQSNITAEATRATAAEQANADDIDAIEAKIPSAATSSNQLADKNYVDTADGTLQDNIDAVTAKIPSAATSSNQLADKNYVDNADSANATNIAKVTGAEAVTSIPDDWYMMMSNGDGTAFKKALDTYIEQRIVEKIGALITNTDLSTNITKVLGLNSSNALGINTISNLASVLGGALLTRRARLTDFSLSDLQSAVADQNLEKYGLRVGDQKTINGHTYVIAGLNPMKGTSASYRLNKNHVGLIVIPHTTQAWNASGNTYTGADERGAGYMNSDLHYYLKNTVLPLVQTDLGSANLLAHNKMLSSAVNTTGYNKHGEANGCASGTTWENDCYISALSEVQVYGSAVWSSSCFDTGEACKQLDVFQKYSHTEIFDIEYCWLRDISTASRAAVAGSQGQASDGPVSNAAYVAALILFK